MKNNGMKPLNLEDGFEYVVNPKTAKNREQTGKKVRFWLKAIVVMLVVIFVNLVLWAANVIPAVPSLWITGSCSTVAAFIAGRLYEVCNR